MGLPYFYREDEAHHFNRVVEMVKEQRLDPEYFHKPSLHFYLRMPVVYASFLYLKSAGVISSMREIVTRDPFGLGGYALSASHPSVVKWNRALSVLFSLGLIIFGAGCARRLSNSNAAALGTAFLLAVSPPLIDNAPIIGVDVLMALCCTATVYFALRSFDLESRLSLFLCCVAAGLAVSSKYNALPVIALPIIVLILGRNFRKTDWAMAVTVPALVFFATSPYILVNAALFAEHLKYEVWHYAIAGHEGHTAERGWPQFLFYISWLNREGVGLGILVTAGAALIAMGLSLDRRKALFLYFPLIYFLMMIMQRANFERNMLVILPFVAALGFWVVELFWSNTALRGSGKNVTAALLCLQPLWLGVAFRGTQVDIPESRQAGAAAIVALATGSQELAVSNQLRFPRAIMALPGVRGVNQDQINAAQLYLTGFDYLVLGPDAESEGAILPAFLSLQQSFPGISQRERITINPEIRIFKFLDGPALESAIEAAAPTVPVVFSSDPQTHCARDGAAAVSEGENYCWIDRRRDAVSLKLSNPARGGFMTISFEIMSPWVGQSLELETAGVKQAIDLTGVKPGEWLKISEKVPVPPGTREIVTKVRLTQVHSPKNLGVSEDPRRLGIAVRKMKAA